MAVRTVCFPLDLTKDQELSLSKTIDLYAKAWKLCVDVAWDMKYLTKHKVHDETYYKIKKELKLKSQYICSSRNKAVESVSALRVLKRRGKKVSKPKIGKIPIRLDSRTLSFSKDRKVASITTQRGRIKIPLIWHRQAKKYEQWSCKAGEIGFDRKNRWVLWLIFEKRITLPVKTGVVLGGDRGIKHPIVLSNNIFYGAKWWNEHERKLLLLISNLQRTGTKSAKRHINKVWRRLKRFRENCDRIIAKGIIASLQPGDTIVLEDLTNIRDSCGVKGKARKKHREKVGRWSFDRLNNTINYNAELHGIHIEYVKANYTSQTCSSCGVVEKNNRKSQSLYACSCGLTLHADLNAARNIANKWCDANGGTPGPIVNRPIVAN